jgi:hypothetical protein
MEFAIVFRKGLAIQEKDILLLTGESLKKYLREAIYMVNQKIVKQYGDCEVTITFKGHSIDIKENVLWLMTENYIDRVKSELDKNSELRQEQISA